MSVTNQPESITKSVNPDSKENISKLKSSRRGYIWNLTKCINRVTLLIDDLVSEKETDKAKQLCNEQELCAQKAFLGNMVKPLKLNPRLMLLKNFSNLNNFGIMNIQNY